MLSEPQKLVATVRPSIAVILASGLLHWLRVPRNLARAPEVTEFRAASHSRQIEPIRSPPICVRHAWLLLGYGILSALMRLALAITNFVTGIIPYLLSVAWGLVLGAKSLHEWSD